MKILLLESKKEDPIMELDSEEDQDLLTSVIVNHVTSPATISAPGPGQSTPDTVTTAGPGQGQGPGAGTVNIRIILNIIRMMSPPPTFVTNLIWAIVT